jgi:hypothetical protein
VILNYLCAKGTSPNIYEIVKKCEYAPEINLMRNLSPYGLGMCAVSSDGYDI